MKYIKNNRFIVVHTHSSVAGILGRIAAKLAGTPVIIHTVHDWGLQEQMTFPKKMVYIIMERVCASFTDKLIVLTRNHIKKGLRYNIGKNTSML